MTLKSLLVYVDDAKSSLRRVDLALSVARNHDAHLTGIGILAPPTPPAYSSAELSPELLQRLVNESRERLDAAETVFRDAVKRVGWEARSDWQKDRGFVADLLGLHARYADLTIIDRDDPYKGPVGSPSLQEEMLLRTGRPLMVIPNTVEAQ
jgi:nucleotide-binding universal stress UspA family protein